MHSSRLAGSSPRVESKMLLRCLSALPSSMGLRDSMLNTSAKRSSALKTQKRQSRCKTQQLMRQMIVARTSRVSRNVKFFSTAATTN